MLHDDLADLTRQADEQGHLPLGESMEILNAADRIAAEQAARDGTLHEPLLPENFHQLTPEEQAAAIPDAMARLVHPHILPDPQAPATRSVFQTLREILSRVGGHIAEKFTTFISTARERFRQSMEYARKGGAEDTLSAEGKFTEQERIFPREGRITPASLERALERLARYDGSALSSKADLRQLPNSVRDIVHTTLKQLGAILPPALVRKMHGTTITLSDTPDMEHASGKYNLRTGRIRINKALASRPEEFATTVLHEAGHWLWKSLSNQSRKIILDHFRSRISGEQPFISRGRKYYRDHWPTTEAGLEDGTEVLTYHLELLALPPDLLASKLRDPYIRETLEIVLGASGHNSIISSE